MAGYRDLTLWQKSMDIVENTYRLVRCLPKEETFALASQMRRAAVSIPSNIAEGHGRNTKNEFARFILIAQGSRSELETQIEICIRLGYLTVDQAEQLVLSCEELGRMLYSLLQDLPSTYNQ